MKIPRLHNGHLLGIVALAIALLSFSNFPLWHSDIWGHAKYGEAYLKLGFFEHEPLSVFTDKEAPFAHVAWLTQVCYFKLYQFGASGYSTPEEQLLHGAEAIRLFHLVLMIVRFTILWIAFRKFGGSSAWAVTGLGLYIMATNFGSAIQRPQALGLFFFTLMLLYLSSPSLPRHAWFVLPISFALWANTHGTFVVGFAMLGLHTLGRVIENHRIDSVSKQLIGLIAICMATTCINPHGPKIYWYVLTFSKNPNLIAMTEWRPMVFEWGGGLHWPYLMSIVLLVFVRVFGGRKFGASGILVALPFAIWPWWQVRTLLWWWMLAMWLLARVGPGLGERFATMPGFKDGESTRWKFAAGVAISVLAIVFANPSTSFLPYEKRPIQSVSLATPWMFAECLKHGKYYPELKAELDKRYPDGKFEGVIFSSETQGDYLIWTLPPEMKVSLFTHTHVFGKQHWDDCLAVKAGEPNSFEILKRMDAKILIVEKSESHTDLCKMIRESSDWIVVVDEPPPASPEEFIWQRLIAVRK